MAPKSNSNTSSANFFRLLPFFVCFVSFVVKSPYTDCLATEISDREALESEEDRWRR